MNQYLSVSKKMDKYTSRIDYKNMETLNNMSLDFENDTIVTSEQIRHFFYCKRIPFFQILYKNPRPVSYLQKIGIKLHELQGKKRKRKMVKIENEGGNEEKLFNDAKNILKVLGFVTLTEEKILKDTKNEGKINSHNPII